jgi:hypothetical protein
MKRYLRRVFKALNSAMVSGGTVTCMEPAGESGVAVEAPPAPATGAAMVS